MNIEVFKNEEFGEIRTVTIDSEPWFVAKDVALSLGYANTKDAISRHCKGVAKHAPFKQPVGSRIYELLESLICLGLSWDQSFLHQKSLRIG